MKLSDEELDLLFGAGSGTDKERALASDRVFVRGQDHLSFDKPLAKGIRLTAWQVFNLFSETHLRQLLHYGSAVIPSVATEPATTLRKRREALGLSVENVAKAAELTRSEVEAAEDSSGRSPFLKLARIAEILALDELKLSLVPGAGGDRELAIRLREFVHAKLSPHAVTKLGEAAWVIRRQAEFDLETYPTKKFDPSPNYGAKGYPPWSHGYFLARKTREVLGLGLAPIGSMRTLMEKTLGIPLVEMDLPKNIAGGTLDSSGTRGVVINSEGHNRNVWIRRSTLAHELGHLLWDPAQQLRSLRVDDYGEIERDFAEAPEYDHVEARANAFAIEFLAPQAAVDHILKKRQSPAATLREVCETFGISVTAATYHIRNTSNQMATINAVDQGGKIEPDASWQGAERGTADYFTFPETPVSRRGRFAYHLVRAESSRHIHSALAANWLRISEDRFRDGKNRILELY